MTLPCVQGVLSLLQYCLMGSVKRRSVLVMTRSHKKHPTPKSQAPEDSNLRENYAVTCVTLTTWLTKLIHLSKVFFNPIISGVITFILFMATRNFILMSSYLKRSRKMTLTFSIHGLWPLVFTVHRFLCFPRNTPFWPTDFEDFIFFSWTSHQSQPHVHWLPPHCSFSTSSFEVGNWFLLSITQSRGLHGNFNMSFF